MSADALAAGSTVRPGTEEAWRDGKRYLWLIGLVVPSLAFWPRTVVDSLKSAWRLESGQHANLTRRYQCLRDFEESPALPTGYAGMIVLALVPPWWRRVMDPWVVAHDGGDVRLAHIAPGKEARYLEAYPPPAPERSGPPTSISPASGTTSRSPSVRAAATGTRSRPVTSTRVSRPARRGRRSDDWSCPDCGVRDKVDFRVLAADLPAPDAAQP